MHIHLKVKTKAKKEMIEDVGKNHFQISVKEVAENNLANKRVLELVATHFKIPISKVHMIKGHKSSSKLILLDIKNS